MALPVKIPHGQGRGIDGNREFHQSFGMRPPLLCLLLYVFSAVRAVAHQNPLGEIRPVVVPDAQGNFRLFFTQLGLGFISPMSMLLAEDGHELIPRHRLSPAALKAFGILPSRNEEFSFPSPALSTVRTEVILQPAGKENFLLALKESDPVDGKFPQGPVQGRIPPFDPAGWEIVAGCTVTEDYAAVVTGYYMNMEPASLGMHFRCCRRHGDGPGVQVRLEHAAAIYDFVRTSPPVWAGERFWIAWVRQLTAGEATTWTTVLTSLDPLTGISESHDLPGISHWNTRVALAVNANRTLCAAWAPATDGSYPGRARIVTAVFPIMPAAPPWR